MGLPAASGDELKMPYMELFGQERGNQEERVSTCQMYIHCQLAMSSHCNTLVHIYAYKPTGDELKLVFMVLVT